MQLSSSRRIDGNRFQNIDRILILLLLDFGLLDKGENLTILFSAIVKGIVRGKKCKDDIISAHGVLMLFYQSVEHLFIIR